MASNAKEHDVFLSYARQDQSWVEEFVRALRARGIHEWFDNDAVKSGEDLSDKLLQALRESETVIVFLSSTSIKNPNVLFEMGAAIGGDKQIIPVLLGEVNAQEVPLQLSSRRWIRAGSPAETGKQVAEILEKLSASDL